MTLTDVLNPARREQIVENVFQSDGLAAHEWPGSRPKTGVVEWWSDALARADRSLITKAYPRGRCESFYEV